MPLKLFAIIRNTFVETVRQPIFGILLWSAAGWIMISPSLAAFSLEGGGDNKILKDIGLATMLLFGLFASVFSAAGVITREIEGFTVLTVVSKPVSRPLFLAGKFLGVAGAMLLSFYVLSLVFLMTVRHGVMESTSDKYDLPVLVLGSSAIGLSLAAAVFGNYVYGWHFSTTLIGWVTPLGTLALLITLFFDRTWKTQSPWKDFGDLQLVYALVLVFMAVLVLTSFAVALSTRFSQVVTLTCCAAFFLVGLLADYYLGLNADKGFQYQFAAMLVPNFQFFWLGDVITQQDVSQNYLVVHFSHVVRCVAYAGIYAAAMLCLGIALFQTREVG